MNIILYRSTCDPSEPAYVISIYVCILSIYIYIYTCMHKSE